MDQKGKETVNNCFMVNTKSLKGKKIITYLPVRKYLLTVERGKQLLINCGITRVSAKVIWRTIKTSHIIPKIRIIKIFRKHDVSSTYCM